ncbi:MAG: chromosome segregation protein SMC [Chromatiales bacterium]|nr:MAG: chromosome segregation protein SMC [Chromatiales bacterium]
MRLSKIKLAGFKSFVDPTTIQLPSNLVGVVGPNGCGKSNVIDAIRWVMGESSAKHLRGDSMADVIFNGSAGRQPVGTATIELCFDNSEGSIGGQYAAYSEISIKRTVSRDGTSQYFLNNARCRRKDITSIFLGTGLGPRSYAIIEQGMVSRLIEAKPDEMRVYIEEAAGVSKYKDRRRETENRIRHTRDNLDRLNDLREEVDKQIKHLQRQARQAERYKDLKHDERRLSAELLVIRLGELDRELEQRRAALAHAETQVEAAVAGQRAVEAQIAERREAHTGANEAFNEIQGRYYAAQSEISRLEQSLAHARENRERQEQETAEASQQLAEIESEISQDREQLDALVSRLEELAPDLQQARGMEESSAANLQRVEEALDSWQTTWHDFNLEAKEYQQTCHVERTRIEHLESQAERLRLRQADLTAEGDGISVSQQEAMLLDHERREKAAGADVERLTAAGNELERKVVALREREQTLGAELEALRGELESRRGRAETLEALQAAALGADQEAANRWLKSNGLADQPRLAQRLRVEAPWEQAVEAVLGDFLQAVCVRRPEEHLRSLPEADIALLDDRGEVASGAEFLSSKVADAGQAAALLSRVRVVGSLDQALGIRARLAPGESVITPDGVWLGDGWVRVSRGHREAGGVLTREQDIRALQDEIRDHEHNLRRSQDERHGIRQQLETLERERGANAEALTAANRHLAEAGARLSNLRQDLDRARTRLDALTADSQAVRDELEGLESASAAARARLEQAEEATTRMADRRPTLERQQQELLEEYNRAREQADLDRENAARIQIEFESRRASKESASTTLTRVQAQQTRLQARVAELTEKISSSQAPIAEMEEVLEAQLSGKVIVEQQLAARRRALEEADQALREAETARADCERKVTDVRGAADQHRMSARETEVRREGLAEQFVDSDRSLDQVKAELPEDAGVDAWEEQLARAQRRIDRLGPINLAAIDEFKEQSERKEYLDSQFEDLNAALETLEKAIRKIDRETRTRFQETFEQVNAGLQRLFPRLFGGGHAYLSLDGDDLLSAGVTVMARPPGKRNSHIHLLSGGEKALTAVALIFSIFELNPAPFCLLDEVDAPLDDANVSRFCDIVKEMADTVQFIVITHNKTTMELARQLTGVTMNEPGVSRLVSVDIDEAVQLAAS